MDSQVNQKRIKSAERRLQALALRRAGKKYREIAQEMGISLTRSRQLVAEGFRRLLVKEGEVAAELLQKQMDRLDTLLQSVWHDATEGDPRSAEVALKIIDRQSKLLGQDAPKRVDATIRDGQLDLSQMSESELKEHCKRLGIPIND